MLQPLSSDDVFQETPARYRAVAPEQWLQRHPEAGSSGPSWPTASHPLALHAGIQYQDSPWFRGARVRAADARIVRDPGLLSLWGQVPRRHTGVPHLQENAPP